MSDTQAPAKRKVNRNPPTPKRVFAVVVVKDESGQPMNIPKGQVEVIEFCRSAEAVLDAIEGGQHPGAIYLSGMLPPGR
jgi:hypothetical protein